MSRVLVFGPDDPARTRFALSPLLETMSALRVLLEPERHQYHIPWLDSVRSHCPRRPAQVPGSMMTLRPMRCAAAANASGAFSSGNRCVTRCVRSIRWSAARLIARG